MVARRRPSFCPRMKVRQRKNEHPHSPHSNIRPSFFSTKTFTSPSSFLNLQQQQQKQSIKAEVCFTLAAFRAAIPRLSDDTQTPQTRVFDLNGMKPLF